MKSPSDHQIPIELSPPEANSTPSPPVSLQERYGPGPTLHTLNVPYRSLKSSTVKTEHRSQSPTSPAAPDSPSTHCPYHPGPLKRATLPFTSAFWLVTNRASRIGTSCPASA